ncbi:hypothetical protein HUW51_18650 [Adhaeribacter swui]|uniref:MarR family transcriptional regulator n=1 Tax=Adhaeribacter swui TaxID=2086471 RepID=A0A7G7GBW4_9BACT|nr:hypothetical protein [Adhaeribacter swui]QNF34648.1 hypothetical protein HUW51_18650 [Adhaeribacter swui]
MTETEFDIIDELYFVNSFADIATTLALEEEELSQSLQELLKKGYVKCFFPDPDTEVDYNPATFREQGTHFYYLATKAGLMAHNSR